MSTIRSLRGVSRSHLALAAVLFLVAVAGSLPARTHAATTATDQIQGIEIFAGVVNGNVRQGATFVGRASGDLPGFFTVSVNYTPPHPGPGVTNTIVSGSWTLWVAGRGTLNGALTGGMVLWNSSGTIATISASLAITGGAGTLLGASGSGQFSGQLSHLTTPPRINGTLQLTY